MAERTPAVFRGKVVTVAMETVALPNGYRFELEVVRHPGGAAVVALDARGNVCMLRQYRHVAGAWLWELPAGKRERGEGPAHTARRELAEEAGLAAGHWQSLGAIFSSPGVFDEVVHLYLAQELSVVARAVAADESIEVHWVALESAVEWACAGTVSDAKSVVGLLRAAAALRGRSLAEAG